LAIYPPLGLRSDRRGAGRRHRRRPAGRDVAAEQDDPQQQEQHRHQQRHAAALAAVELVLGGVGDLGLVGVVDELLAVPPQGGPHDPPVVQRHAAGGEQQCGADDGAGAVGAVEVGQEQVRHHRQQQRAGAD
jgi:hypothetical protein